MAHPKRKISKTRRDKRRTILKLRNSKFQYVRLQVSHTYTTEHIGMRGSFITEEKF